MGNQHGVRGKAGKRRVSGQGTHSARPERSVQRDEEVSLSVLVVLSEEGFEVLGRLPGVVCCPTPHTQTSKEISFLPGAREKGQG